MRWLCVAFFAFVPPVFAQSPSHTVRIGVLGIFHSQQFVLSPGNEKQLLVSAGGHDFFLQIRSSCSSLSIRKLEKHLFVTGCGKKISAELLRATARDQQSTELTLAVPGKIRRTYKGVLELRAMNEELVPVIAMDLEIAVASVVLAETYIGTPIEALKAQAIVTRSYLAAGTGRHKNFDFCDLTHCEALREPPPAASPAAQAAVATKGLVLAFEGKPVATMFTRSCGGHTLTPRAVRLPQANYPYFSVVCEACKKDPVRWTRTVSAGDAALFSAKTENGRLAICRRLGWNTVPSNDFVARDEGDKVILEGTGQGHGIGLCQRGAVYMAGQAKDFREILAHYFPKTTITLLDFASEAERKRFRMKC